MSSKNKRNTNNKGKKSTPYQVPTAPKETVSPIFNASPSSALTYIPNSLNNEIINQTYGLPPNKTLEFETFDISHIATPNQTTSSISPKQIKNDEMHTDEIVSTPAIKDRSKLLDIDEHIDDDNMEEDLKEFTIVTKATPYAIASFIPFTPKERSNSKIILTINNTFAQNDDFKGVSVRHVNLTRSVIVYFTTSDAATAALHVTIPDLKIEKFTVFPQYKDDMRFNERTIHVTDIPLQMKPATIKQVFSKYGNITDFRMSARGMWQHAYITYETPKCIELFHQVWSRFIQNDSVRVNPCTLTAEEIKHRNTHRIKLTNLPFGTSARDLHDIILATKAKAFYIFQSNNYKPRPFIILHFESEVVFNNAVQQHYVFGGNQLSWCSPDTRCCHKCGDPEHIVMKCPLLIKSKEPKESDESQKFKSSTQLNTMNRLYNKYKPAGFRKFVSNKKSYSEIAKNNKADNSYIPPPSKDHNIHNSVKDSIHNPNNEINRKLDQILNILSNLKKDMNDLDVCIAKLEAYQKSSELHIPSPPLIIPTLEKAHIQQISPLAPPPLPLLKDTSNKRTRISESSSDETFPIPTSSPKPDLNIIVNEQAAIIAAQKTQMDNMFKQIEQLAYEASQNNQ